MSLQMKGPTAPISAPGQMVARPRHAAKLIDASVATVYRLEASDPTFPRRIKFGPRFSGYRVDELERWVSARATESRGTK